MSSSWQSTPHDFRGRRATVMGLGAFGGGEAAARFLAARGAHVIVTDLKPAEQLQPATQRLADLPGITYRLGGHDERDFIDTDLLVVSPAVPRDSPYLLKAVAAGIPVTSEMNLFWQHNRGRVVGVTGTNGKSTTTTLIHSMLHEAGVPCRVGGNIGVSLLPEVEQIKPDEWVVLELSSFQLADLDALQRSPQVAVVTNFSPNHLDRHASLDEYRHAKQTVLRWQDINDTAILNAADSGVSTWPTRAARLFFGDGAGNDTDGRSLEVTPEGVHGTVAGHTIAIDLRDHLSLRGRHNRLNVAAAALAASVCGAEPDAIAAAVRDFRGLPHRLQYIGQVRGRWFYNDSKATTPEAAIAAIAAFDRGEPLVLLAGGSNKHVDLTGFAAAIARRVKAAALLGETAPQLAAAIQSAAERPIHLHSPATFREAFDWAVDQSLPGDTILLSPGCASYGWFANYEDRGNQFAALVRSDAEHSRGLAGPI